METAYIKQKSIVSTTWFEDPKELFDQRFFKTASNLLNAGKHDFCKNKKSVIKRLKGNPVDFVYQVRSKKRAKNRNLRSQDIEKIFYTSVYGKLVSVDNPDYIPTE